MHIQYLTNNNGETVAVQMPIEDWNAIVDKYADIEELPKWQKKLIDIRLEEYKNHPENIMNMEDFEKLMSTNEAV